MVSRDAVECCIAGGEERGEAGVEGRVLVEVSLGLGVGDRSSVGF